MIALLALFIGALDHGLKHFLLAVYPDLVTRNSHLAFGWGNNLGLALGIILFIGLGHSWHWQPRSIWLALGISAIANLIDRLTWGSVLDYIAIGDLRFNLNDLVIIVLVTALVEKITKSKKQKPSRS